MRYEIEGQRLTDIADAIRGKTGKSATITPEDMPDEIASIETSGGAERETVTYYGWVYGIYRGFAVMETLYGVVYGKVNTSRDYETLSGSLISFSFYGDNSGPAIVQSFEDIDLTVYTATASSQSALIGTTYRLAAFEEKELSFLDYNQGYYLVATPVTTE